MRKQRYKILWIFVAALVALQSLPPAVGLAEVSVRCAGAPVSAPPCLEAVVSAVSPVRSLKCAGMPCCRNMASSMKCAVMPCCRRIAPTAPARGLHSRVTLHPAAIGVPRVFSTPACVVTVKPILTFQPATVRNIHCWMLNASPALAPPAIAQSLTAAGTPFHHLVQPPSESLLLRTLARSHGLRAPPAA